MSTKLDEETRGGLVLTAVVFEGGLAVLAWLLGMLLQRPPLEQIVWQPAALVWGTLAAMPLLAFLWAGTRFPWGPLGELQRVVRELIVPLFRRSTLVQFAIVSAVAGVGEEMLFRGFIQEGAGELFGSRWAGLLVASLAFGLAHPITRAYAVVAALIGAYLGWLWMTTDNLLVPIITHAVYDFCALVYLVRVRR